jgi:glycosyltransferase involved in cell wall biosynthesis
MDTSEGADTGAAVLEDPATQTHPHRPGGDAGELPSVSVVVPVLEAAEEIDVLLDALERLDYPRDRLEILVVDNGSRDGTPSRVARRSQVRLLHETRIRSSYAARNRGVDAASGEWVAFTDADCAPARDWLRRLLAPPVPADAGAVVGEVLALESSTPVQRLTERYGIMKHAVTMPHKALPGFSTANVAIRRALLRSLGGFREDVRFFGDMELAWRMQIASGASLVFRPDAVVRHRHRRTWRALWRQGRQHGQGVAFMKSVYPDRYRIRIGEQMGRIGQIVRALVTGAPNRTLEDEVRPFDEAREVVRRRYAPDRWGRLAGEVTAATVRERLRAPIFLIVWYGGMAVGYLKGPAWSEARGASGAASRHRRRPVRRRRAARGTMRRRSR